ncbi:MAG TPA: cold shock domain-containing protein [Burkholderiales bacterium]|nr:cold shock domain-containing protein [Burkholderiales bacterium]
MATGTVRRWWRKEGFGFVVPDDGSAELFGRGQRRLRAGQRVEFSTEQTAKGSRAVDVKALPAAPEIARP